MLRAREGVMAPIRDMLSETGVTEQQWRVLRVLAENGSMDTQTLAARSSLLFPSLTRMVTSMLAKGLITQRVHETDRRRKMIAITDAGQRIIDDRVDQTIQIVQNFRARLGDENYETLLDLLGMLDPAKRD